MADYRPDIDGLRAVAILPVVLFHAGVFGFSGGYVGVDVFFVISGFLITSIIREEMQRGRFTLAGFYERRARRILPAYFVTMSVCLVLASWALYPHQFLSFSRSLIAASLFVSSFLFRSEAGYFDLESEEKPLLHTWSLSVEEIFYIFFPLLLIMLHRRPARLQIGVLTSIAVLSLTASSIALALDPRSQSAFFLPYSRVWELMLGALLAYGPVPRLDGRLRGFVSLLGIAMIGTAVFGYSEDTVFPGLMALLPCGGAALVILAGQQGASIGKRALSSPGMVWIGKISYSLYLWHWPLLVFARTKFGTVPSLWVVAAVIGLSVLLAALSTSYIERPTRRRNGILSRRQVFRFAGAGLGLLVLIGSAGVMSNGWSSRYPPEIARILFAEQDQDPRRRECLSIKADATGCVYGDPGAEPWTALWGDSHAAVYSGMLGELAAERKQSLLSLTMPSCPPVNGWALESQSWRASCLAFQERAMRRILETSSIRRVLLTARFAGYPFAAADSGFETALRDTIRQLHLGGKQVLLIYPVPESGEHVPLALTRTLEAGGALHDRSQPIAEFRASFGPVLEFLDRLVRNEPVGAIEPARLLCDEQQCYFSRDGIVLYYDQHHLSLSGARELRPLFLHLF